MKPDRYRRIFLWGLLLIGFYGACYGCRHMPSAPMIAASQAAIVQQGLITCFPADLKTSDGGPVTCEASAVVFHDHRLIIGSDKPLPGESYASIFTVALDGDTVGDEPVYLTAAPIQTARKFEDFALTPDRRYLLATTGFDRIDPASSKLDPYNTLLIWPVDAPERVQVVAPTVNDGITSSVGLRQQIRAVLKSDRYPDGPPYFKIEGLTAIPGDRLLFGVREQGARHDDFDYVAKIIAAPYTIQNDTLVFTEPMQLVYEFDPTRYITGLRQMIGLSSLAYDPFHQRLYLLTSYEICETDRGLGGFLWTLPITALDTGMPPQLVYDTDYRPLLFAHKAEGIAVLGPSRVLVIHDDDRVLGRAEVKKPAIEFHRQANQAAYSIVAFTGR